MNNNSSVIYFVEDDRNIRDLVVYTLRSAGFEATGCAAAPEFFAAIESAPPALVLLDVMLPGMDGVAILKQLKKDSLFAHVPVIMVTAKDAEYHKVEALDLGADDYVTKPFGMMELLSRVKAVLRRSALYAFAEHQILSIGAITLNPSAHVVEIAGTAIDLTLKEYDLLEELMRNEGILLSRDHLLNAVWGYSYYGATRTVDVHIRSLRKKIGDVDPESAALIVTVRGVGYKMVRAGQAAA